MESRDRDRLDQWLDGVLRQNESAEPRPGLESRVLARIAVESKRHRTRKSWAWIVATASVAALFAMVGLDMSHHSGKTPNPAVPRASTNSVMPDVAHVSAPVSLTPVVRNRSHRNRTPAIVRTRKEPKPEHFPSPRPLSPQELVLASYAQRFPAEAALIAQEQREFEQEIAKAQEEAERGSSGSNP